MRKVDLEYDRILFSADSLVDYWWYVDNHLQMVVRFMGIQVGSGETISEMDIPEAVLIFRNVGNCTRTSADIESGVLNNGENSVSDDLKAPPVDATKEFSFFAQCTEPSGNVNWDIKAETHEILLRDEDVKRFEKAENDNQRGAQESKSTW